MVNESDLNNNLLSNVCINIVKSKLTLDKIVTNIKDHELYSSVVKCDDLDKLLSIESPTNIIDTLINIYNEDPHINAIDTYISLDSNENKHSISLQLEILIIKNESSDSQLINMKFKQLINILIETEKDNEVDNLLNIKELKNIIFQNIYLKTIKYYKKLNADFLNSLKTNHNNTYTNPIFEDLSSEDYCIINNPVSDIYWLSVTKNVNKMLYIRFQNNIYELEKDVFNLPTYLKKLLKKVFK